MNHCITNLWQNDCSKLESFASCNFKEHFKSKEENNAYVQWVAKVMTPASMYFLWKQGSWLLWPAVQCMGKPFNFFVTFLEVPFYMRINRKFASKHLRPPLRYTHLRCVEKSMKMSYLHENASHWGPPIELVPLISDLDCMSFAF